MKKLTLTPCLLSICLGLLVFTGGLYDSRMAFCQEEEEPIQTRPRPDMHKNPLKKQMGVNPEGHMQVDAVKNKQAAIADDGQHGDGMPRVADDGQHGDGMPRVADDGQHGDGMPRVADDGQHGDGLEPSMQPAKPARQLRPNVPKKQLKPTTSRGQKHPEMPVR